MKKSIAFILSIMLVMSIAFPNFAATTTSVPKEKVSLVCIQPGDISKRMSEFLDNEYKDKLLKDLNMELKVNYISWANYYSKLDLMLAAGEKLDWYWDYQDFLSSRISKKACIPLNDLLEKYGQAIKKVIPAGNFKLTTLNKKIYALPTMVTPVSDVFMSVLARQDLLEGAGIKNISTIEDVLSASKKIKAKYPNITPLAGSLYLPIQKTVWAGKEITSIGTSSLTNTFYVKESADNKVYFGMEPKSNFIKRCSMAADFVKNNYLAEQELTEPANYMTRFESGNYAFALGAISRPMENFLPVQKNAENAKLIEYKILPSTTSYIRGGPGGNLEISPFCENPERVMMYFNWIYQSEDNYDFHVYGVKGKDYKLTSNGRIEILTSDSLWYEWEFRNAKYMKFPTYVSDQFVKDYKNWDSKAKYSKLYGFTFDSKNVKAEEAKIASVITSRLTPLISGYGDAAKEYNKVYGEFRAAGIQKYMAELQKQVNAFLSTK
jgi:putative aldouronate transport system substrate-binding protein